MKNLKGETLVLFFTCGISLKTWQCTGILEREIKPYNSLAQHFKKIYFITYGGKEELQFCGKLSGNIEILPKPKWLPVIIYQFFIPLIYCKQLKDSDVYKTNQMGAAIPAVIARWLYKKKLIVRCGYEWLEFARKEKKRILKQIAVFFIEKIAYGASHKIIVTSNKDKQFVEENFNITPSKIEIIPNYIDAELFKPMGVKTHNSRIIFIGRLHSQKNLFNLIEAVSKTPYELVIIGGGPLKKEIEVLAKNSGVNIIFKANIPNEKLPEELNASEIFILPSLYEGCPKALLEAMSCGIPCIGTDVEGIKEIIRHKENGYLCNNDVNSIRNAIEEVLQDTGLQEQMGIEARQTILENFDFPRIMEKEMGIYESIS